MAALLGFWGSSTRHMGEAGGVGALGGTVPAPPPPAPLAPSFTFPLHYTPTPRPQPAHAQGPNKRPSPATASTSPLPTQSPTTCCGPGPPLPRRGLPVRLATAYAPCTQEVSALPLPLLAVDLHCPLFVCRGLCFERRGCCVSTPAAQLWPLCTLKCPHSAHLYFVQWASCGLLLAVWLACKWLCATASAAAPHVAIMSK